MSTAERKSGMKDDQLYGYTGKIARINLTDSTVEIIPTSKYAPKYIGGRAISNKIYWDEVGPEVKAFDPENLLIFMTGPDTATGVPTGGRTSICGLAPNNLPEQYCWGNFGGWFGATMKFAGYDGIILVGKAKEPSYVLIDDDKISFLPAGDLWGRLVHDTQNRIREIHGEDVLSMVIGPAGENLCRNASITTSNDNVAAKAGFGAVMGSKNVKAIAVRGTGSVTPYDIDLLLKLRKTMGMYQQKLNPIRVSDTVRFRPHITFPVANGVVKEARMTCSHGCNQRCNLFVLDAKSAFGDKHSNQIHKCIGVYAFKMMEDCGWTPSMTFHTKKNMTLACLFQGGGTPPPPDKSDPYLELMSTRRKGNNMGFWDGDYDRGNVINDLCTQYGIDKWDVIVWLMTWLKMGKDTGVLADMDLGMEIDVESEEFMRHLLEMIVYRKGYYGNLFAEGMARTIRVLGKEKFGDTIYKGITSNVVPGKQLDIPISFESSWGHCYHWQGRGFQGINTAGAYLPSTLMLMTNTRDSQTNSHIHDTMEYMVEVEADPCHDPRVAENAYMGEVKAELKESITCCDFQSPHIFWTDMECQMLEAATGIKMTEEELYTACERSKNLFRAILIRNHGRTRELEVNESYPPLQYPDCEGRTFSLGDYNDLVDLYYDRWGWDRETGWPTRATYERCGMKEIADELEALGKLPA